MAEENLPIAWHITKKFHMGRPLTVDLLNAFFLLMASGAVINTIHEFYLPWKITLDMLWSCVYLLCANV